MSAVFYQDFNANLEALEKLADDRLSKASQPGALRLLDERIILKVATFRNWYFNTEGFSVDDTMMNRLVALTIRLNQSSPGIQSITSKIMRLDQVMASIFKECRHKMSPQEMADSLDEWTRWKKQLPMPFVEAAGELWLNMGIAQKQIEVQDTAAKEHE